MTSYVHLRRYGKKPGSAEVASIDVLGDGAVVYRGHRYDLRTGEKGAKQPGFAHHLDGRYLEWDNRNDACLEIHHPDGRVAKVLVLGGKHIGIVGPYVVHSDDGRRPWLIADARSGELLGRVEDQRGDATYGTVLYNATWFDPKNDRTLWLCEGSRLAELDVAARRMARTIEAAADQAFVGVAALPDGHVVTLMRSAEDKAKHRRDGDRLVLFSPTGEQLRDIPICAQAVSRLGDYFLISDDRKEQFVVLDRALELVVRVEMYEPGRDGFNVPLPLPSGREWIGVGGRGEWDHYGPPELAPVKPPKARTPAKSRRPAKRE